MELSGKTPGTYHFNILHMIDDNYFRMWSPYGIKSQWTRIGILKALAEDDFKIIKVNSGEYKAFIKLVFE